MENENKCRTCSHSWEEHGHCGKSICVYWESLNYMGYPEKFCGCKEYIPGENLEFLEWKNDRKLDSKFGRKSNEDLPNSEDCGR